jgi:2-phospho-L-lactate guanylyltransferase
VNDARWIGEGLTAVVPFRCPWHGKTRLRQALPPKLCDAIAYAMFRDVVAAVRSGGVRRIVALVHGPCGLSAAREAGTRPIVQPLNCRDLTAALRWITRHLSGTGLLIVAGDLPCLGPGDIEAVLSRPEDIVVAPTQDGGTAIMAMRSPSAVTPAFGGPSAARHVAAARRAALSVAHLEHHDGYRDVDSFADLREALLCGVGAATLEVIHRALKQPASHDDRGAAGDAKIPVGAEWVPRF